MRVDELLAVGAAELAAAQQACARSSRLQHSISWNIAWARVLRQHQLWPSGGSDTAESEEARIRRNLRELIDHHVLPKERPAILSIGKTAGGYRCVACRRPLVRGQIEVEITMAETVRVFFHRRCLDLWPTDADGSV